MGHLFVRSLAPIACFALLIALARSAALIRRSHRSLTHSLELIGKRVFFRPQYANSFPFLTVSTHGGTGAALSAPKALFPHLRRERGEKTMTPMGFRQGMKLEARDPLSPEARVCVATVQDVLVHDNR